MNKNAGKKCKTSLTAKIKGKPELAVVLSKNSWTVLKKH